mmetsp:Transcript_52528/g.167041  ORF Transcript_52528/g.167041 Transcript_52528/m.167041 type:complete len:284 (+) Transcript_52528:163-1014(+)
MTTFTEYPLLYIAFLFPYVSLLHKAGARLRAHWEAPEGEGFPVNHARILGCIAWTASARLLYFLTGLRVLAFIPEWSAPLLASCSYFSVFTAYTLIFYCWAESCHMAHPHGVPHPRWMVPRLAITNLVMYWVTGGLFLCLVTLTDPGQQQFVAMLGTTWMCSYYVMTAVTCVGYGYRMHQLVERFVPPARERQQHLDTLSKVTGTFTCCFLLQALMTYLSYYQSWLFFGLFYIFQTMFLGVRAPLELWFQACDLISALDLNLKPRPSICTPTVWSIPGCIIKP